jgi:Xaa-Pro aminopeptidase
MTQRVDRLRARFSAIGVDAFLVTFLPHLRYLSGFSGSAGAGLVTSRGLHFFTDGRYSEQIRKEVRGAWKHHVSPTSGSLFQLIRESGTVRAGMRVGFDGNTLLYQEFRTLKKTFPGARFLPKADVIEPLAAVKDESEIRAIRKAVEITDRTFGDVLPMIKPGVRESEIAAEISYLQRTHGAEKDAFDTIAASGPRSALPHGHASSKKVAKGELLTLDFGCVVDGYHSDMTRTIGVGRLPAEAKKVYALVLEAQTAAVDAARAGMKTSDLDATARAIIGMAGHADHFQHSLGHGIGLQIHEAPRISVQSRAVLEAGNVVTIEPGVYIPGLGGVRIEDDVVIGEAGCRVLTRSTKELVIV